MRVLCGILFVVVGAMLLAEVAESMNPRLMYDMRHRHHWNRRPMVRQGWQNSAGLLNEDRRLYKSVGESDVDLDEELSRIEDVASDEGIAAHDKDDKYDKDDMKASHVAHDDDEDDEEDDHDEVLRDPRWSGNIGANVNRQRGGRTRGSVSVGGNYRFRNGGSVRVSGNVGTGGGWGGSVGVNIPFGKKRDSANNEVEADNKCKQCLDVQPMSIFKNSMKQLASETKADLVVMASYNREDFIKGKNAARFRFLVREVFKTPTKAIRPGETLDIDENLLKCACLKNIESGVYFVTGTVDKSTGKLVLSGNLVQLLKV